MSVFISIKTLHILRSVCDGQYWFDQSSSATFSEMTEPNFCFETSWHTTLVRSPFLLLQMFNLNFSFLVKTDLFIIYTTVM